MVARWIGRLRGERQERRRIGDNKVAREQLPVPSTQYESVVVANRGPDIEIRFEYYRDGSLYRSGIRFEKVRAHRWRGEAHCLVWHVDQAYDTIVQVQDSSWVEDLSPPGREHMWGRWVMRHFMIYLDSEGCHEVVAESYSILPEDPVE